MPQLTLTESDIREVDTEEQLCALLRKHRRTRYGKCSLAVSLHGLHQHQMDIAFVGNEAIIHITPDTGLPPYMITLGCAERDGVVDLMLHGRHHTQIQCRHLVDFEVALDAIRFFWRFGELSPEVQWEQI